MRALLVLVIILLILLGVSPFVGGYMFKRHYYDFITKLNAVNPNYKVQIVEYRQGWLSSDAVTKVSPADTSAATPYSNFNLVVNEHILHGPIIVDTRRPRIALGLAEVQSVVPLAQIFQLPELAQLKNVNMTVDSVFNFGNQMVSHVEIAPFDLDLENAVKVKLQGLKGDIRTKVRDDSVIYDADFTSGAMELNHPLIKINVEPIKYLMTYELQPNQPVIADTKIDASTVSVRGIINLTLNNLFLQYGMPKNSNDMVDINTALSAQTLTMPDFVINSVNNFKQNYSIKNLSASGLVKFQNYMQTKMPKDNNITSNMQEMVAAELALLTPKTHLVYHLEFTTNLGGVQVDANVFWPENVPMFKTAEEFTKNINVTADIRAGIALVNQVINLTARKASEIAAAKMGSLPASADNTSPAQTATPQAVASDQDITSLATQKLNDLITQGYIIVDQTRQEYIVKITRDATGFKLNNKLFDPSILMSPPATSTSTPAPGTILPAVAP